MGCSRGCSLIGTNGLPCFSMTGLAVSASTTMSEVALPILRAKPRPCWRSLQSSEASTRKVTEFLAYGAIVGEHTLFQGIRRLPGGSIWTFRHGAPALKSVYFKPVEWDSQPQLEPRQYADRFLETLRVVLPRYFAGPIQLGISLTGGLDTRMIVAGMP